MVPDSVVSSYQIDKHGTSPLLGSKRIRDVLSKQNSLIHGRPSPSEPSLLPREKWVNNRLNTNVYESLEDLAGDAKQGDGTVAFRVLYRLLGFRDRHYQCSSPHFWNFEVMQAGRKEATQPGLQCSSSMGYLLRKNSIWVGSFSCLQVFEGSSQFLRGKTLRGAH